MKPLTEKQYRTLRKWVAEQSDATGEMLFEQKFKPVKKEKSEQYSNMVKVPRAILDNAEGSVKLILEFVRMQEQKKAERQYLNNNPKL